MRRARRLRIESLEPRLTMCAGAVAMQPATELTAHEQQMLEWINRTRANPAAEASRLGISLNQGLPAGTLGSEPRQPLAPNTILHQAASGHTEDMLRRGYFGHVNPDGDGPGERADDAGYPSSYVGENLSARAPLALNDAPLELHSRLFLSPSHRVNTLLGDYREAGLGLQHGSITFTNGQVQTGSIVTQLFGGGNPSQYHVTGVAYDDTADNNRYDIGEGRGGLIVEARDQQGNRIATTTGSSGGYSLRLSPGSYRLFAFPANRSRVLDLGTVNLVSANVKKDVPVEQLSAAPLMQSSIVVSALGQTVSMSDPQVNLTDACRIDLRGFGGNVLRVDAPRLRDAFNSHVLMVMADADDSIQFDAGWSLASVREEGGGLVRRFQHTSTFLDVIGPSDFTNPLDSFDVNASGSVTSSDALAIINELAARRYSSGEDGAVRPVSSVELEQLKFFDVTADGVVSALDALRVINEMGRRSNQAAVSGEAFEAEVTPSWEWLEVNLNRKQSDGDKTSHGDRTT